MAFMNPSFGGTGSTPNTDYYDYPSTQLQQPFVGRRYPGTFDEFMQTVPQNETDTWKQYWEALTTDPNLGFDQSKTKNYYDLAEEKARADAKALSLGEAGESGVAPGGGTEREMMSRRYGDITRDRAGAEAMDARLAAQLQAQTRLTGAGAGYQGAMSRQGNRETNYFTNLARQNVQQAGVDINNVRGGRTNIPTALSYGASPMRTPQSNTFGSLAQSSTPSSFFGRWGDPIGYNQNKIPSGTPGAASGVGGTPYAPGAMNVNNPAGWPSSLGGTPYDNTANLPKKPISMFSGYDI